MSKDLPQIKFKSKFPQISGIEILRLEGIAKRKSTLSHNPERPHQANFYQLIIYTNGATENLIDFVRYKAQKKSLFYISIGQVYSFKFNPEIRGYVILFTEEYFKKQMNNLPNYTTLRLLASHLFTPKTQIPSNSNVLNYVNIMFDEFHKTGDSFNKKTTVDSLFTIILSKLEELKQEQTSYIRDSYKLRRFFQFHSLLKDNYTTSRNAEFYASQMNITYKYLNEICKEITNSTSKQFIDEFILLEAKRQLTNSGIRSTDLAYRLGFNEPTNFIKYFKKHTGLTPNQFKNSL